MPEVYLCGVCLAEIQSVADEWVDGVPVAGHRFCPCGATYGVWLDGGMLDLSGLERDPGGDFELFSP